MSGQDSAKCVFLGEPLANGRHECAIWGKCTELPIADSGLTACTDCPHRVLPNSNLPSDWHDPLMVTDRMGRPCDALRNMLDGGAAMLVCGGPSLNEVPHEAFRERGIFSLGVNNAAAHVPTSAFTCADPPAKFHNGIFEDPKVFKFLPLPKLQRGRGALRRRDSDGTLVGAGRSTCDCPNVWGYERRSWLMPDDSWFTEPSAAWGNHKEGVERTGQPKTVCTMLLGLRLLQYLGARKIFLVGVDFHMAPGRGDVGNYAFGEAKHASGCLSNNDQYAIVGGWLSQLRPVFERWGHFVYNTNERSHLRAFDYVPFETAMEVCRGRVPPLPWDLKGWYEK